MKYHFTNWIKLMSVCSVLLLLTFSACKDDDPINTDKEVTAVFSYTAEGNKITFVNASVNATAYVWTFDDGETSTDKDAVHTYASPGTYSVTLKASNPTFNDEVTIDVITENSGPIASVLVGKTWVAVRQESYAYSLGPEASAGTDWDDLTPLWFSWGDKVGAGQTLYQRRALANDEYTFNEDGSYNVDFHGDFWGEFGVWAGNADANEVNMTIGTGGTLPVNVNGNNVNAFVSGTWNWVVDEVGKTLEVKGAGAHILNPRLKTGTTTFEAGTGIKYHVDRIVEGAQADTLVIYVTSNDGANNLREYHTLAAYHGDAPAIKEPAPPQHTTKVNSTSIGHTFVTENGKGTGVGSVAGPYAVTYGVVKDGQTSTEFVRGTDSNNQYGNYLMRTNAAEINFTTGTTVKVDVYFPSTNDYTGALTKKVFIRFIDESRLGGNFWQEYIQIESADVPLNTWTTLTFDFASAISTGAAAGNSPDGVMIEFGGSNHFIGGTFYAKNWVIQ